MGGGEWRIKWSALWAPGGTESCTARTAERQFFLDSQSSGELAPQVPLRDGKYGMGPARFCLCRWDSKRLSHLRTVSKGRVLIKDTACVWVEETGYTYGKGPEPRGTQ